VAGAFAQAAVRCGFGTYEESFQGFVDAAASGDCHTIIELRDEDSLYATCLPWWKTAACSDVETGNLDPTCVDQLLHN
jgi:hypothetical protein